MSLLGPLLALFPEGILGASTKDGPVCCEVFRSPRLLACQEACRTGPLFNFAQCIPVVASFTSQPFFSAASFTEILQSPSLLAFASACVVSAVSASSWAPTLRWCREVSRILAC